jgi:hypothetical protein
VKKWHSKLEYNRSRLEYQREWRAKNREKVLMQSRARYARTKEEKAAKALERYWKNPERCRAASKRWKEKNKERVAARVREKSLVRNYGLTEAEYRIMLEKQHGGCAICGSNRTRRGHAHLDVDHCHETGIVRGLLCNRCNRLIAQLEICGDQNVKAAQAYLEVYNSR